ncbi:MAG TPA: family 78 glycoside hydrolase catalytic domain [Cyclobacteriaceae bacterium]|nr:family 78 glycoside hydrolase catalytic domain [Cyclobacteriaceae bacterium]
MNFCKLSLITFFLALATSTAFSQTKISNLLCENLANPVGIDKSHPRLSWQIVSDQRSVLQTAYEIRVGTDLNSVTSGTDLVWSPGRVLSEESVHIIYSGEKLESGKKYFWQVRIWDNKGGVTNWSEPASWQMGLLDFTGFTAAWISPGFKEDTTLRPCPVFRKKFQIAKKVSSATAYITAHGLYEAWINGKRVGDAYFTPGWTSYNKRLQYQVYDVSALLNTGDNAIGVILGNGWYRGYVGYAVTKNFYGDDVALLLQLNIVYSDGTTESVISDGTWTSSTEAILSSEFFHGETYDARKEKPGWKLPSFNDSDWTVVDIRDFPRDILTATYAEPVRKHETFKPVKIFKTPKGEQVIDFGQNLVGWVQVKATGKAGDSIILNHAEVLDKNGNFYTENLRQARARDIFILKGGAAETFEPRFTFHGFRYVKVSGYPGVLNPANFTAVALYSDMPSTGYFNCSNRLINQLQHNIQWGQKGNFVDIPTDCPQRDERLGWTGDAQAFSRTAAFNMGVNNFFSKWLKDLSADQGINGAVPFVIPDVLPRYSNQTIGAAGWSDAAVIIPWNLYLHYGDRQLLNEQYPSMKSWINYLQGVSKNDLWNTGFQFGDWLSYRAQENDPFDYVSAVTDKHLVAQCFYANSTQLLIHAAEVLGYTGDVEKYTALLDKIKQAFLKEYVTPNGRLVSDTQTAYVLALAFDMLPEKLRPQAVDRLIENIRKYKYHLTTGFLGTPHLCHVLSRFGHADVAFELLLQETYPSWLYPVKMGATTIWERWDGIRPDSTFQDAGMNSFNHYAYGAIGDWLYRVMAGIDTDESNPGYKQSIIKPHYSLKFSAASASLQTYYGTVSSSWKIENKKLTLDIEIPANTTAMVHIPAKDLRSVTEGGKALFTVPDLQTSGSENGYVIVKAGSGKYHFLVEL